MVLATGATVPLTFKWYIITRINSTTQVTVRMGFSALGLSGNPPTDGIYFENITAGALVNWDCITRAASAETNTDTGSVMDTSFHTFLIEGNGTNVLFYIDGVLKCTQATNLPTAALVPFFSIIATEAVAKNMDLDAFIGWLRVVR